MEGSVRDAAANGDKHCWRGFEHGRWNAAIDVRDFIVRNVVPYTGDESFLARPDRANPERLGQVATVLRQRADRRVFSTSMQRHLRHFWRTAQATLIRTMR